MKKGYALAAVMAVAALLSAIAVMTYNSSNLQTKIVHNDKLYRQARLNAQTGITYFLSKRHHYDDLVELSSGQEEFLLMKNSLSDKDYYQVHIKLMPNETFEVTSHGMIMKKGSPISAASLKATFKSKWITSAQQ